MRYQTAPCPESRGNRRVTIVAGTRAAGRNARLRLLHHNRWMTARLIDGKAISSEIKREVREATDQLEARGARRPGLAVVMVGESAASQVYVRNKRRSCIESGIISSAHDLPASTEEAELLSL